jgi:hypothetical protein
VASDNTITTAGGPGLYFAGLSEHSFVANGNTLTCTGTGCTQSNAAGIWIADDGQQVRSESVIGNVVNGFKTGLQVLNLAHEFNPLLSPNALNGNPTPTSPASIGTALPIVGGTVTNLSTIIPPGCSGPSGVAAPSTTGVFITCNGAPGLGFGTPSGGNAVIPFYTTAGLQAFVKFDDVAKNFQFVYASTNLSISATAATINVPFGAPNIGVSAPTGTALNGQILFGNSTAAPSNCGTLTGASGCLTISIAGTPAHIPYYP